MIRNWWIVIAVSACAVTLNACSVDSNRPRVDAVSPSWGSTHTPPSPPSADVHANEGTIDVKDEKGFNYRITYRYPVVGAPVYRVTNATAGLGSVDVPAVGGSLTLTNTGNKEAPTHRTFVFGLLFKSTRPACQNAFSYMGDFPALMSATYAGITSDYCALFTSEVEDTQAATPSLPPNGSVSFGTPVVAPIPPIGYVGLAGHDVTDILADFATGEDARFLAYASRESTVEFPGHRCEFRVDGAFSHLAVLTSRPIEFTRCTGL